MQLGVITTHATSSSSDTAEIACLYSSVHPEAFLVMLGSRRFPLYPHPHSKLSAAIWLCSAKKEVAVVMDIKAAL